MYKIHVQNIQWKMNEEIFISKKWIVAMKFQVSFFLWKMLLFSSFIQIQNAIRRRRGDFVCDCQSYMLKTTFLELQKFKHVWNGIHEHRAHTHTNIDTEYRMKIIDEMVVTELMKKIIFLTKNKISAHFIYSSCPKIEAKHFQCNHEMKTTFCINIHWSWITLKSPVYFYWFFLK